MRLLPETMYIIIVFCVSLLYAQDYGDMGALDNAIKNLGDEKARQQTPVIINTLNSEEFYSESDSYHSRKIVVENDSVLKILNAIQVEVDSLKQYSDRYYLEMIELSNSDRIRYSDFLLTNKLKTKVEIVDIYKHFHRILLIENDKLNIILDTQTGNNRAFLHQHIKNKRHEMLIVNNIILKFQNL